MSRVDLTKMLDDDDLETFKSYLQEHFNDQKRLTWDELAMDYFILACCHNSIKIVDYLLKCGIDVNGYSIVGIVTSKDRGIHKACLRNNTRVLKRLLEHPNIDLKVKGVNQRTVFSCCSRFGVDNECYKILEDFMAEQCKVVEKE